MLFGIDGKEMLQIVVQPSVGRAVFIARVAAQQRRHFFYAAGVACQLVVPLDVVNRIAVDFVFAFLSELVAYLLEQRHDNIVEEMMSLNV